MPATRTHAQQAAARANGARSRGPATEAGKARSACDGTRHGLRGGPFALLPDEDREEFTALHAAVSADWRSRDAYERRWVRELVAALWRQERLRGLEFATFAAAESPPSEATMRKLLTFARYGARIDKDIGRALYALRALCDRPDARIAALQNDTPEPGSPQPHQQNYTNEMSPRTCEPERRETEEEKYTIELAARTFEPEPANSNVETCTAEPEPPALNRHQRRPLEALARKRRAA
ncbi:MAG: hypothetical protein AB7I59_08745 [Geminicoccaceae bacterium]